VAAALSLQPGDALGDDRAAGDQRRPRIGLGRADRRRHRLEVVPVHFDDVPVGDAKAGGDVFADRQARRPVVGDAVVVPEQDQLAQAQVPRERDHFLADALLQATVADEGVGAVVDHAGAEARVQVGLGDRHAEGVGNALAERTGRHLDTRGVVVLGWPSQREPKSRKVLTCSMPIRS
jgi:hypothetical protein